AAQYGGGARLAGLVVGCSGDSATSGSNRPLRLPALPVLCSGSACASRLGARSPARNYAGVAAAGGRVLAPPGARVDHRAVAGRFVNRCGGSLLGATIHKMPESAAVGFLAARLTSSRKMALAVVGLVQAAMVLGMVLAVLTGGMNGHWADVFSLPAC